MEFSRQEYWSGLLFPSSGDVPDPGIQPASLASPALAGRFFTTEPPGKPKDLVDPKNVSHLEKRGAQEGNGRRQAADR